MLWMIALVCTIVVAVRCSCAAKKLEKAAFDLPSRYYVVALSYALMFAGALGILASNFDPVATGVFMSGVAGRIAFDRRSI